MLCATEVAEDTEECEIPLIKVFLCELFGFLGGKAIL